MRETLKKGQITAILNITRDSNGKQNAPLFSQLNDGQPAAADKFAMLQSVVEESINRLNEKLFPLKSDSQYGDRYADSRKAI